MKMLFNLSKKMKDIKCVGEGCYMVNADEMKIIEKMIENVLCWESGTGLTIESSGFSLSVNDFLLRNKKQLENSEHNFIVIFYKYKHQFKYVIHKLMY